MWSLLFWPIASGLVFFVYPSASRYLTDLIPHSHILLRPWGIQWLPEAVVSVAIGVYFLKVAGVDRVLVGTLNILVLLFSVFVWGSFAVFVLWLITRGGL
jgi:hypothetical protein